MALIQVHDYNIERICSKAIQIVFFVYMYVYKYTSGFIKVSYFNMSN